MPTEQPQSNVQQPIRVPEGYQPAVRENGFEMPTLEGMSDAEVDAVGKFKLKEIMEGGDIKAYDGLNITFPKITPKLLDDVYNRISRGKKENGWGNLNKNRVRALWLIQSTLQKPMAIFNETEKGTHSYMSIYKDGHNITHQLVVKVRQDGTGAVITSVIVLEPGGKGHSEPERKGQIQPKEKGQTRLL